MKIKILTFLTFIVLTSACDDYKKKIQGDWAIDELEASFSIKTNGLNLRKDKTCELPMVNISDRHTDKEIGTWQVFQKEGKSYLQIKTSNTFFNRTYEVTNLHKVQDTVSWGFLLKMTLISDNLKMHCTKALYE
jgi:hypothetical protein